MTERIGRYSIRTSRLLLISIFDPFCIFICAGRGGGALSRVKRRANWILEDLRTALPCIRITEKIFKLLFQKMCTVSPRFAKRNLAGPYIIVKKQEESNL